MIEKIEGKKMESLYHANTNKKKADTTKVID